MRKRKFSGIWNKGLLGDDTPEKLLNTLVFLLGMHCTLHAGKEYRALCGLGHNSQFQFHYECGQWILVYTEDIGLKTNKGGLKECKTVALYLHPIENYTPMSWYYKCPVGVNTLQDVVKKLCQKAGLEGHYTNHLLRSTCVTRIHQAGVDEQLIAEVTGHRSLAICLYKHLNDQQRRAASSTLSQPCDMQDSTSADLHG